MTDTFYKKFTFSSQGTYNIEGRVYNEHQQEMICGIVDITVLEGIEYK